MWVQKAQVLVVEPEQWPQFPERLSDAAVMIKPWSLTPHVLERTSRRQTTPILTPPPTPGGRKWVSHPFLNSKKIVYMMCHMFGYLFKLAEEFFVSVACFPLSTVLPSILPSLSCFSFLFLLHSLPSSRSQLCSSPHFFSFPLSSWPFGPSWELGGEGGHPVVSVCKVDDGLLEFLLLWFSKQCFVSLYELLWWTGDNQGCWI